MFGQASLMTVNQRDKVATQTGSRPPSPECLRWQLTQESDRPNGTLVCADSSSLVGYRFSVAPRTQVGRAGRRTTAAAQ